MLLVQEYLRDHSLEELVTDHGVEARVFGHKASFNYNQIEAKDNDPIVCECRGLILSKADGTVFSSGTTVGDTKVLAQPFFRFFNFGQGAAAPVDFDDKKLKIYDKKDGSLIIVYFDELSGDYPEACIATRSVSEADLPMSDGRTFAELVKSTILKQTGKYWEEFSNLLRNRCSWGATTWCFELCTPYNSVVVQHNESKMFLLYAMSQVLLSEYPKETLDSIALTLGVQTAPLLHEGPLTIETCMAIVNSRSGKDFEGVVACDSKFRRIKIKNAEYLALHKITSSLVTSCRSMATLILNGSEDDILPLLAKELQKDVLDMKEQIVTTCKEHEYFFHKTFIPNITRKDFAIACQQNKEMSMGYMMDCYTKGYKSFIDWMRSKKTLEGEYPKGLLDYWCK